MTKSPRSAAGRDAAPHLDFSRLLETLPAAAVLIDEELRVVGANDRYRARLPRRERVIGNHCYALEHGRRARCGENGKRCPLEECRQGLRPSRQFHVHPVRGRAAVEEVVSSPVGSSTGGANLVLQLFRRVDRPSAEPPGRLVGGSPAIVALRREIGQLRARVAPVLVQGEPGTEREPVARELHAAGPRREGPFALLHCGGARGGSASEVLCAGREAFWEALHLRQAVHEGTLYLDDVTLLPPACQQELFLNLTGTRRSPGSSPWSELWGARWIFGAARPPESAARAGDLLPELVPRLLDARLVVPPLRARPGDLPLLNEALRPWLVAPPELEIHP